MHHHHNVKKRKKGNVKYMGEKDEVLETGIEMSLLFETDNLLEVGVVNMCINPKESLKNILYNVPEI